MEPKKEDYRNKWQRENQERIIVMVAKGRKDEIKAEAEAAGQSVNAWVVAAIDEKMEKK